MEIRAGDVEVHWAVLSMHNAAERGHSSSRQGSRPSPPRGRSIKVAVHDRKTVGRGLAVAHAGGRQLATAAKVERAIHLPSLKLF